MLTRQMNALLHVIDRSLRADGVPPSYDEMREALSLKSKSGIHRLIESLEARGFIRRLPNRARAIEILRMPGATPSAPRPVADNSNLVEIPVMGRIAAGTPIAAIQVQTGSVAMPASTLGKGDHFALEVRGNSMIDAGILDGDTAILRRQDDAANGDIVVALVDGEEATLKRFRRNGRNIALEPANSEYVVRLLDAERVAVQGRLVGITRSY